jgi:hypothetical protein
MSYSLVVYQIERPILGKIHRFPVEMIRTTYSPWETLDTISALQEFVIQKSSTRKFIAIYTVTRVCFWHLCVNMD